MPHGKTLQLLDLNRMFQWRRQAAWEPKERDRSLRGKARRNARKAANR